MKRNSCLYCEIVAFVERKKEMLVKREKIAYIEDELRDCVKVAD